MFWRVDAKSFFVTIPSADYFDSPSCRRRRESYTSWTVGSHHELDAACAGPPDTTGADAAIGGYCPSVRSGSAPYPGWNRNLTRLYHTSNGRTGNSFLLSCFPGRVQHREWNTDRKYLQDGPRLPALSGKR